jgi:hypothetical protein
MLGLVAALAALTAAAAATLFSGAFLNSSDRNRDNSGGTGNVEIALEQATDGAEQSGGVRDVIPADDLRPGGSPRSGTLRIVNEGSLPVVLSLDPAAGGSGALAGALRLQVEDCGTDAACGSPTGAYDGLLGAAPAVELPGTVAPNAERVVRVSISWPASYADMSLYGTSIEPQFKWIARSLSRS